MSALDEERENDRPAGGRSIALFTLYTAWQGLFGTAGMPGRRRHGPLRLSAALEQRMSAGVVPPSKHPAYRGLLGERRLVLQDPRIIDPGDGYLVRREALAPLRATSGSLMAPQRLLAAFGSDELYRVLRIGREQLGVDAWARGGHFCRVSERQGALERLLSGHLERVRASAAHGPYGADTCFGTDAPTGRNGRPPVLGKSRACAPRADGTFVAPESREPDFGATHPGVARPLDAAFKPFNLRRTFP